MTDVQPGQSTNGVTEGAQTQDSGFNVTFDEGNAGGQATPSFNNTTGSNSDGGDSTNDTRATDVFNWVPEDYREEFRNDEGLSKYTSQNEFIKDMLEQRKTSVGAIKLPGAEASEEEWSKVYAKLGRPETPEGYELSKTLPEGLDFNEDMYNEFTQTIHTAGLSKKQATKLYEWYNGKCAELNKNIAAQVEASYKKSVDDAVVALKKEWGTDYQKNLDSAVAMANKFLSPATKQYLNASKLGNNPLLIKDFYNLSKQVSGAQMRGDGPSGSVSSLAELEAKLAQNLRAADYTTNKSLQQENKEIAEKIAQLQSKG